MKYSQHIGEEKYQLRELAQLVRRRMLQQNHKDKSKYSRKNKHSKDIEE